MLCREQTPGEGRDLQAYVNSATMYHLREPPGQIKTVYYANVYTVKSAETHSFLGLLNNPLFSSGVT